MNISGLASENVTTNMVGPEEPFSSRTLEEFRADYSSLIGKALCIARDA